MYINVGWDSRLTPAGPTQVANLFLTSRILISYRKLLKLTSSKCHDCNSLVWPFQYILLVQFWNGSQRSKHGLASPQSQCPWPWPWAYTKPEFHFSGSHPC